jgi:hypothetical protein
MSRVQSSLLAYGSTTGLCDAMQVSATRIVGKKNQRNGSVAAPLPADIRGIGETTRSRLLTYRCDRDLVAVAGDFSNRSRWASTTR